MTPRFIRNYLINKYRIGGVKGFGIVMLFNHKIPNMDSKYRIKEVLVPFKDKTEVVSFYPQVKSERDVKTGFLWWKKTTIVSEWYFLYKKINGGYFANIYSGKFNEPIPLYFSNKNEAENAISEYEIYRINSMKTYWQKISAIFDDDSSLVKFHDVVKPILTNEIEG